MAVRTNILMGALALISLGIAQQARPPEPRLASDVATYLAQQTSIAIYLDSRIVRESVVVAVAAEITQANLEDHIKRLVKALPDNSTWAKLYLPPPPKGKTWKGDEVIAFARAQATLFGLVGSVEPGAVEILSQRLSPEKAKAVIAALNLKPVYIVTLGRGTFAGIWTTTYGEMRLTQTGSRVSGTYTSGKGRIEGVVTGDVLRFRWEENATGRGGPGTFTLSEDGDSFAGQWAYDESVDSAGTWTGTRISRR